MKIGILSQWFDPEPGPAAIPGVFGREFASAGHDVNVLTGFPNYPEGALYPGYRIRARHVSRSTDLNVTRVAIYPNHSASALGRMANYASFGASASAFGRRAMSGLDAVWVYNSPVTVAMPLLLHTSNGRIPYFLHVQDLWPDSLVESGMFPGGMVGRGASAVINRIVRRTEDRSAVVGVISPSVRELILSRNSSLDPNKIVYVPNPTDEDLFVPIRNVREATDVWPTDEKFTLMYVGALGDVQGLQTVLEAAAILQHRSDIEFVLVGDGIARRRLEKEANDRGLQSVRFVGRIPKESVPEIMAGAHAQLVSLADSEFLRFTTPSKIASLLASEVPIIAQISGDGAEMLEQSGAALTSHPGDADALARTIVSMASKTSEERAHMAARGRAYYLKTMSARVSAQKITDALQSAIDKRIVKRTTR